MPRYIYNTVIVLFLSTVVFTACKKTDMNGQEVPSISIASVTPITPKEYQDSVIIILNYTDNDGDLGFANPDSNAIEVHDSRLKQPDYYHLAPLTPNSAYLKIQGTLRIKISSVFILGQGNTESTTFAVRLKDRAGHWSNTAVTPLITITK